MKLYYNDVLDAWKNFLQACSDKAAFEQVMAKLNQIFSKHYHAITYDGESMIYMENLHNIAYKFTYDIILKDDNKFNHERGGDVQIDITINMVNIDTHEKSKINAVDFIYKYCNPDCRPILEKATIELL